MFYSKMHQSEEFVPPSSGEESENENFESVLLNQVSSDYDHDKDDNSARELQMIHVVTDIETLELMVCHHQNIILHL